MAIEQEDICESLFLHLSVDSPLWVYITFLAVALLVNHYYFKKEWWWPVLITFLIIFFNEIVLAFVFDVDYFSIVGTLRDRSWICEGSILY
jgi:hypothetical protein